MGMIWLRGKIYWIKYYRNGKPYQESANKALGRKASLQDTKTLLKSREGAPVEEFNNSEFREMQLKKERLAAELSQMQAHIYECCSSGKNSLEYPEIPLPIKSLNSGELQLPIESGIYFLWKNNKIVYVGRAKNLQQRVKFGTHHVLRDDFMISFLIFPVEKIQFAESYYIGLLKPDMNFGTTAYHRNECAAL